MAHGSLHQFKAFLERRNARKEKTSGKFDKGSLDYDSSESKTEYDFPSLSESELEKVKEDIRKKIKKEKRIQLIVVISLIVLMFFLFYSFFLVK